MHGAQPLSCVREVRHKLLQHWLHALGDHRVLVGRGDEVRDNGNDADGRLDPDLAQDFIEQIKTGAWKHLGPGHHRAGSGVGLGDVTTHVGVADKGEGARCRHR